MEYQVNALVIGGYFDRMSSHWCYDTAHFKVLQRIYTDNAHFSENILEAISKNDIMAVCFSGKNGAEVAKNVEQIIQKNGDEKLIRKYESLVKAVRIQNTNIPNKQYSDLKEVLNEIEGKSSGASWLKVALDYDFDIVFTQTYGNNEIINSLKKNKSAIYLPFAYNDRRFYPRNQKKQFDIGMFFKIERHSNRLGFIEHVMNLIYKNNWSFCLSNGYWGNDYAEQLGKAKIILHYSYVGDVPYRLYETAGSKGCFLTDKLQYGVEKIFTPDVHFYEYDHSLYDLEKKIDWILSHDNDRINIEEAAYDKAKNNYTWEITSERIVVPSILAAYYKKQVS